MVKGALFTITDSALYSILAALTTEIWPGELSARVPATAWCPAPGINSLAGVRFR